MNTHIRIQNEDFDVNDELEALSSESSHVGAVASFVGLVRGDDKLTSLTLEHYPGMTEREIKSHVDEASKRWPLLGVTIIHRVGTFKPGDHIVVVAVASSHRNAAFEATQFLMDYLKTQATFWKLEVRGDKNSWVEAKASDSEAVNRWK